MLPAIIDMNLFEEARQYAKRLGSKCLSSMVPNHQGKITVAVLSGSSVGSPVLHGQERKLVPVLLWPQANNCRHASIAEETG